MSPWGEYPKGEVDRLASKELGFEEVEGFRFEGIGAGGSSAIGGEVTDDEWEHPRDAVGHLRLSKAHLGSEGGDFIRADDLDDLVRADGSDGRAAGIACDKMAEALLLELLEEAVDASGLSDEAADLLVEGRVSGLCFESAE